MFNLRKFSVHLGAFFKSNSSFYIVIFQYCYICCHRAHSFRWHVQNATIPCRSQELLPFLCVMYLFLPPFSTNYSSILSHLILAFLSILLFPNSYVMGILFSSILCTCPNKHNLFNLIFSITVGFLTVT